MSLEALRARIRADTFRPEGECLAALLDGAGFTAAERARISERAVRLVREVRAGSNPAMMELFLSEYGLSTEEGVALMCLAEALLRVPDAETVDELIEDKIVPGAWSRHLGHSHSPLVNASTWALYMTGQVLDDEPSGGSVAQVLRGAIRRLGEPVIRTAVARAMKEMGRQFVLGETIEAAMGRAAAMEARGYTYSYDMLGEAARTADDAARYHLAYADAIAAIAPAARGRPVAEAPGISVKLSALHPRYEPLQRRRVLDELVPRALSLASLARSAGIGLNIDAEEADRLDLSLDVIEALLAQPALAGWDGFGVVVQAYGRRAMAVLDWLHGLAAAHDRRLMVRLVKGAYWDTEIKRAQVAGHPSFPVFTRKPSTDVSFLAAARRLLAMTDRIYPQFATHNAHTVAAILQMAPEGTPFEFQRLHGMGEALHDTVLRRHGTRCRIYAPVGAHKDLLAYLVRRLLENGANSSFVNQLVDEAIPPERVAADPVAAVEGYLDAPEHPAIVPPPRLFAPRENSRGYDLGNPAEVARLTAEAPAMAARAVAAAEAALPDVGKPHPVTNPATGAQVGTARFLSAAEAAAEAAQAAPWDAPVAERAAVLRAASDLFQAHDREILALLTAEAGKTLEDAIAELREAVDFLRYYAAEAERRDAAPRGLACCISPWNFPLAIFTGQVAAALACGNGVLAKPAEATPLIAARATALLHAAGVPAHALRLVPGAGGEVGPALLSHPSVAAVAFTGSTETARAIHRTMAAALAPGTPLVAETGGQNAMVVDSTALPEQAVTDIVTSAFRSAGQRCSALRVLYVQEEILAPLTTMLTGAMDALRIGDPADPGTDVGPVIDAAARARIEAHIAAAEAEGRLIHRLPAPRGGSFVGPALLRVGGIEDCPEEIFGPVLHLAGYRAERLDAVIDAVNASGFGLTFGLHTRIDERVQRVVDRVEVGNVYVNRNQIGAVVGSQPFGGHGLSGTGPKAGGPHYLDRFCAAPLVPRLGTTELPGPTGETNRLSVTARRGILCLGPGPERAAAQARAARAFGCQDVREAPDAGPAEAAAAEGITVALREAAGARPYAEALAAREGPIVPLVTAADPRPWLALEKTVCVDTTAAGGNAALLAAQA